MFKNRRLAEMSMAEGGCDEEVENKEQSNFIIDLRDTDYWIDSKEKEMQTTADVGLITDNFPSIGEIDLDVICENSKENIIPQIMIDAPIPIPSDDQRRNGAHKKAGQ
jgi:hypothetical protein